MDLERNIAHLFRQIKLVFKSTLYNLPCSKEMRFRKTLFLFCFIWIAGHLSSQDEIAGRYLAVDDRGGEPKSIVEVYYDDGGYRAKVVELLPAATVRTCDGCKGEERGASLVGIDVFWGLTKDVNDYRHGEILDPRSGKTYRLLAYREGKFLVVRGYLGIPLFGLSLYWERLDS